MMPFPTSNPAKISGDIVSVVSSDIASFAAPTLEFAKPGNILKTEEENWEISLHQTWEHTETRPLIDFV